VFFHIAEAKQTPRRRGREIFLKQKNEGIFFIFRFEKSLRPCDMKKQMCEYGDG
jgi:hypothetical protein